MSKMPNPRTCSHTSDLQFRFNSARCFWTRPTAPGGGSASPFMEYPVAFDRSRLTRLGPVLRKHHPDGPQGYTHLTISQVQLRDC